MPASIDYMRRVSTEGKRVVGASSMFNDPAQELYTTWHHLPFVNDGAFERSFLELIDKESVATVYTPHPVVGRFLKALIERRAPKLELIATNFENSTLTDCRMLMQRVTRLNAAPFDLELPSKRSRLAETEIAALMQHALRIEGQSSEEKIIALMEIMRHCPEGDIVEIGSLLGRSAFILSWLALRYNIGKLLCLDSWSKEAAFQYDSPEHLNQEVRDLDFDTVLQAFILNLLPYNMQHINYLRGAAHDAVPHYKKRRIHSDAFGDTDYTGHIACLHIDGNHDEKCVQQDIEDWVPFVVPGGWIIVDDYQWTFGDGPRVAADRWMHAHPNAFDRSFVCGSALFIRLRA